MDEEQFFLTPGYGFRGYALDASRPLSATTAGLRKAVDFAIDRAALRRAGGGRLESRLTDQYLRRR